MRSKSFYLFVQTVKNPYDYTGAVQLAAAIHDDTNFPKTSEDYHEISSYLEDHTNYVQSMDDFDQLWQQYLENT
ncbi:YozE family protein [Vagococcus zengguangii]|uniref:YozE family protein n=1 Tax=Vagococcus zengguangii TaxID=2571750 RepID=A0A4D7CQT7_9ENTE|nr:YozE family protein [Vagococcus zengguangii]QCI86458.1 YozE family protein [Vagococcus zengguangii]TLG81292.1 YozE family protein [Vagococcus zengguangii]